MGWDKWLHLFVIVAMASSAWRAWKALPKPLRLDGRRYYPQPDGSFRTAWGRRIKDPAIMAALDRASR